MSAQAPPVAAYAVDSDSEEEDGELHIYDDCNEIRRKIKAMLAKGQKITPWLREIGGVNSNSYQQFMKAKGPTGGCQNRTYRAAYEYFERQRIAEGKPKSKKRLDAEAALGSSEGFSTVAVRGMWCGPGNVPVVDEYGRVSIAREF
ncbi:hypothetical protein PROFUN_03452 [Planoprotostelium fungivorum]|uniref:DUF7726 domain-containing protein n=1 Tax=Planoprotostelium fungivorum TaxID=1890364 RepID=A0A2P6MN58_9EUKA|nr:hypothetical protein PROFUN_03452 [Planoprotostelium fungivorum]